MRLSSYLIMESTESGRTKEISKDEFIDLARKHCKNSVKGFKDRTCTIYRGDNNSSLFIYGDAGKSNVPRKSRNTSNHYTLWMDNHPSWSHYPKRSMSFICASGDYATGFGKYTHIILPYDGVNIGVTSGYEDLWDSSNLCEDINYELKTILRSVFAIDEDADRSFIHSDESWATLKRCIELFDDYDDIYEYAKSEYPSFQIFHSWKGSLWDTMEYLWSPKENEIWLGDSKDDISNNNECWMEGPVLMLDETQSDIIRHI